MLNVNEIFCSIEGEGIRAGKLVTFVRFSGCNLRCSYCDTVYAQELGCGTGMRIDQIICRIKEISKSNLVTLTGGEPLWRDRRDLYELIGRLTNMGYQVNIETNGSIDVTNAIRIGDFVMYTVDYKCPSSGMSDQMYLPMYSKLESYDVVKFVVGSKEDLDEAVKVAQLANIKAHKYLSPVFGEIKASEIVDYMKEHHLDDWTIQLQMHKYIWDPEMRGV